MEIKPGTNLNIIVNIDHMREIVDVKNSVLHDISGRTLVIAQTDPPISRMHTGKELYLTFLEKRKGETKRYGFTVKVIEFIKEYELSTTLKVQAVVLKRVSEPEEYNLRMFFRLEPPGNCGIEMYIEGKKLNILDISIGGAKLSHDRIYPFQVNETATMTIEMDGDKQAVEAMVLRVWQPEDEKMKKSLAFLSVQFIDLDAQFRNNLARKIRDIERDMRYKEVYTNK